MYVLSGRFDPSGAVLRSLHAFESFPIPIPIPIPVPVPIPVPIPISIPIPIPIPAHGGLDRLEARHHGAAPEEIAQAPALGRAEGVGGEAAVLFLLFAFVYVFLLLFSCPCVICLCALLFGGEAAVLSRGALKPSRARLGSRGLGHRGTHAETHIDRPFCAKQKQRRLLASKPQKGHASIVCIMNHMFMCIIIIIMFIIIIILIIIVIIIIIMIMMIVQ